MLLQNLCHIFQQMSKKANCVTVSQKLFDCSSSDENFLKNAVKDDETWVYGYNIVTKAQSLQWVEKSLL
jgi:hypothetical protein